MEHQRTTATQSGMQSPSTIKSDVLVTTDEAARILDLKPSTLTNWRCTKRVNIPYVKIGGRHVRYRMGDLMAFQISCLVVADGNYQEKA